LRELEEIKLHEEVSPEDSKEIFSELDGLDATVNNLTTRAEKSKQELRTKLQEALANSDEVAARMGSLSERVQGIEKVRNWGGYDRLQNYLSTQLSEYQKFREQVRNMLKMLDTAT
jgi:uncharacterized phage infection (PIP) family protein YhgE